MDIKNIKYIALDFDGTLLNDDLEILPKTKEALLKVQDKGINLIVASGRPVEGIIKYAKELKIDKHHGLIIASNGAIIYDCLEEKDIFENKFSAEEVKYILEKLKKFEIYPFLVTETDLYVDNIESSTLETKSHLGKTNVIEWEASLGNYKVNEVGDLATYVNFPVYKINASADPDYIDKHFKEFDKEISDVAYCARTLSFSLEFIKKGISKGHALEKINAKPEEIIAFGDSMNDLEMMKYAKYGVAMKNAMPEVKDIAFEITDSNNDEGIYKFLEKHGFLD